MQVEWQRCGERIEGGVDRLHEMAKDMRTETHQHNVSVEPRTARAREWGC